MNLIRYIFCYDLIGHVPATTAEISPRPQMASPKLLLQMREIPQQLVRRLPLQPLDHPADRYLRWNRHEQMHMILPYVPFHDRHFVLPTDFSNQIPCSRRHFSRQRRSTIFRRPNQMQMDFEYGVRSASIFFHPQTLPQLRQNVLKPSPKGEGFNPPRVGQ